LGVASLVLPSPGHAHFVLQGSADLGGAGFGAVTSRTTAQNTGSELSTISFSGGTFVGGGDMSGPCCDQGNKNQVLSVGTLNWLSGANVGLGLNTNQINASGPITLTDLTLTL